MKLEARQERGPSLEATAFALVRGQPASEPPPVALQVSRWRPNTEGEGWRSDVVVRAPEDTDVTWEHLERVYLRWEGEPWCPGVPSSASLPPSRRGHRLHP